MSFLELNSNNNNRMFPLQLFLQCRLTLWSSSSCLVHQATGWRTTSSSSHRPQEQLQTRDSCSPLAFECPLKKPAPGLSLSQRKDRPLPAAGHKPTTTPQSLLSPLLLLLLPLSPMCLRQLRLRSPPPPSSLRRLLLWPLRSAGPPSHMCRASPLLRLPPWFSPDSPRTRQPPSRGSPCTQSRLWPYSRGVCF